MPLVQQHQCIFFHIPKTGGSSIEQALGVYRNKASLYGNYEHAGRCYVLQHLTPTQMLSLGLVGRAEFDANFKFAIVRNPWDRLVSEYSFRDQGGASRPRGNFTDYVYRVAETLEMYPHGVDEETHERLKSTHGISLVHLSPQCDFVFDRQDKMAVNYLGRFERLTDDFRVVCQTLSIDIELEHLNPSHHREYGKYYNAATKELVGKLYAKDIDAFGYRFETQSYRI